MPTNLWGPPKTSGNSTPLRENIPESPTDSFPDFAQLPTPVDSIGRRGRSGTLPTNFPPGAPGASLRSLGLPSLTSRSSRPTPSATPYKSPSPGLGDIDEAGPANGASLLSRLRAGSLPQRTPNYPPVSGGPFGSSVFSSGWAANGGRERTSTLASIASLGSNEDSPSRSIFSNNGAGDGDMQMRTLDYLGLVDTPQPPRATLATAPTNTFLQELIDQSRSGSRYRSYSVNAAAQLQSNEDTLCQLTPYERQQYALSLETEYQKTTQAIAAHNQQVQAWANQASNRHGSGTTISRPRAKTMGVINSQDPRTRSMLGAAGPSNLGQGIIASDFRQPSEYGGYSELSRDPNLDYATDQLNQLQLASDEPIGQPVTHGPSSSLWLGSIPASTTPSTLEKLFEKAGEVESSRILTHKNCGFVNYKTVEAAVRAKALWNGKEIFAGHGPIRINFATPPSSNPSPGHDSPSPDPNATQQKTSRTGNGTPANGGPSRPLSTAPAPPLPSIVALEAELLHITQEFGASDFDVEDIKQIYLHALAREKDYHETIELVGEPTANRVHDAQKLRDIRKRIDQGNLQKEEIENIAIEMLDEIAELSADYLGNTVVQKLFEHCSDSVKDRMLERIAPEFAKISCHKNGTWAAQKIVDRLSTQEQFQVVADHLGPYTLPLFKDQYGNYVAQLCLRFGAPISNFLFETMLTRLWELGQERFAARSLRSCLENHACSQNQLRMLAAAIVLYSVHLSTNTNGALLLTWYLDTCSLAKRRTVLAPVLLQHLVYLGTHKLAYLTVLKIINQKNELEARDLLVKALFFDDSNTMLEDILKDEKNGATFIHKVLTGPFWTSEAEREKVAEKIKSILVKIRAQPGGGYQRLMTELKMLGAERNRSQPRDHGHPGHQARLAPQPNGNHIPRPQQQQMQPQYFPIMGQQSYDLSMQRTDSQDSNMTGYPPQFGYGPPGSLPMSPVAMMQVPQFMPGRPGQQPQMPQMGAYYAPVGVPQGQFANGYSASPMDQNNMYRQPVMMGQQVPNPLMAQMNQMGMQMGVPPQVQMSPQPMYFQPVPGYSMPQMGGMPNGGYGMPQNMYGQQMPDMNGNGNMNANGNMNGNGNMNARPGPPGPQGPGPRGRVSDILNPCSSREERHHSRKEWNKYLIALPAHGLEHPDTQRLNRIEMNKLLEKAAAREQGDPDRSSQDRA